MNKTFYYLEKPITFQADCYNTIMVNIIELADILNKDPFLFLGSEKAQETMNALKKQIEQYPPTEEHKIINIESSSELYVHSLLAIGFIGDNHKLNIWFSDKRLSVGKSIINKLTF